MEYFRISLDMREAIKAAQQREAGLPNAASQGILKASQILASGVKVQLFANGNIWSGYLFGKIHGRLITKYVSGVFGPQYGAALDHGKPHWVALKRGRKVTMWARAHDIKSNVLWVRPHPYIQNGIRRVRNRAKQAIKMELNKTLRTVK